MQWPYGVKPLILLRLTLADCTKSLPHPEMDQQHGARREMPGNTGFTGGPNEALAV